MFHFPLFDHQISNRLKLEEENFLHPQWPIWVIWDVPFSIVWSSDLESSGINDNMTLIDWVMKFQNVPCTNFVNRDFRRNRPIETIKTNNLHRSVVRTSHKLGLRASNSTTKFNFAKVFCWKFFYNILPVSILLLASYLVYRKRDTEKEIQKKK